MALFDSARAGIIGTYHAKHALNVLVHIRWVPARWLKYYLVVPKGGTELGLLCIFQRPASCSSKVLSEMLNEFVHRLRADGLHADNQPTIGMALCWHKRLNTPASRACLDNRLDEARAIWQEQFDLLRELGISVLGR